MGPKLFDKITNIQSWGLNRACRKFTDALRPCCDKRIDEAPYFAWRSWALKESFESGAVFALSQGKFLSQAQLEQYLSLKDQFDDSTLSNDGDFDLYNIKSQIKDSDLKTPVKAFLRNAHPDLRLFGVIRLWYGWALMKAYKDGAIFAISEGEFNSWMDFYERNNDYVRYMSLREKVSGEPCPKGLMLFQSVAGFEIRKPLG
jgi:hypothetical protein